MKKLFFIFVLILLALLSCVLLAGCSEDPSNPEESAQSTGSAKREDVYVVDIVKTGSEELTDTYTVFYSDGSKSFFAVTNGRDGQNGISVKGEDGHTPVISISDDGYWMIDGVDSGVKAAGEQGSAGLSAYQIYKKYYPGYTGSEKQWIEDLISGKLSGKTSCTLTFDANGGSVNVRSLSVVSGECPILPVPKKEGKLFLGWFTGFGGNDMQVTNYTPIYKSMKLVAKWDSYDVIFEDGNGDALAVYEVPAGGYFAAPSKQPVKVQDAFFIYHFDKWDCEFPCKAVSDMRVSPLFTTEQPLEFSVRMMMELAKNKTVDIPVHFEYRMFDGDARVFNKDVAQFAFANAVSAGYESTVRAFYTSAGFEDIFCTASYNEKPTEESVAYAIAHKTADRYDLISVCVRGMNYGAEWGNNFYLSGSGNHAGFEKHAKQIAAALESYASEHPTTKARRYLICGYSRGGGIANVLASQLMKKKGAYTQENTLVYTFEAPRALTHSDAFAYKNVFNVVNSADLITKVAPLAYGLYRCGVDVDIYSADIDGLIKAFDRDVYIPPFSKKSGSYESDRELASYVLDTILDYNTFSSKSLRTRALYVENYQECATYLFSIYFSMSKNMQDKLVNDLRSKGTMDILSLLAGDGLYNFLVPYLRLDRVSYDAEKLKACCPKAIDFLTGPAMPLVLSSLSNRDQLPRLLAMHYPEVTYVLLLNYSAGV